MPSEDNWRAQDDMRTLTRAKEIELDKKRMSAAQAEARREQAKLSSIVGKPKAAAKPAARGGKLNNKRI